MAAIVNYFPPISSSLADPWMNMVGSFVSSKVATLVNPVFRSRLATAFTQEVERAAVSGVGGDAVIDVTRNGGVLNLQTGTTGSSFRIVRNVNGAAAAGVKADFVANPQTAKWSVITRVAMDAPTAGCQFDVCRMTPEAANDCTLGVLGSTSTANWAIKIGTGASTDTGVALPAPGVFVTVALIADGSNVQAWSVDTGASIGSAVSQATVTTTSSHVLVLATNTAAVNKNVYIDDWAVFTEMAA